MGRLLLDDFLKQKNNLTAIILIAILSAAVGFAFQMIYACVGLILTAGISIIYFNSFFSLKEPTPLDEDKYIKVLQRKLQVRTKFVEIIVLSVITYIIMYAANVADAFDRKLFHNPNFSIMDNLEQITVYPLTFMLIASVITPLLFKLKINKAGFVSLAILSILFPYGVFLLNFFFHFTEKKILMSIIPPAVICLAFISYIFSLIVVIRKKY